MSRQHVFMVQNGNKYQEEYSKHFSPHLANSDPVPHRKLWLCTLLGYFCAYVQTYMCCVFLFSFIQVVCYACFSYLVFFFFQRTVYAGHIFYRALPQCLYDSPRVPCTVRHYRVPMGGYVGGFPCVQRALQRTTCIYDIFHFCG